jgi:hypothetical protein
MFSDAAPPPFPPTFSLPRRRFSMLIIFADYACFAYAVLRLLPLADIFDYFSPYFRHYFIFAMPFIDIFSPPLFFICHFRRRFSFRHYAAYFRYFAISFISFAFA